MRAVVAVPWRAGVPTRERNWALVQAHLERLRLPMYTGDSDPGRPMNHAAARNAAVRAAGDDWDVVLFVDADTLFTIEAMEEAIGIAYHHDIPAFPCESYVDIDPVTGDRDPLSPNNPQPGGGSVALSRTSWRALGGGWDERFADFGFEDMGLCLLIQRLYGEPHFVPGTGIRLGHARTPAEVRRAVWRGGSLWPRYQRAAGDRTLALQLVEEVRGQR